ncbi:ABC transporter permease [Pedobacter sp. JCM 36344]|uniref:ABC transporter permease n=1 Tax=Pedobacter sp. JCM 36344 TaxID=3374280 RepID=UPI0039789411
MNLKLILDIAFSLLRARWSQTLVAAIGVTFSITMFIALLSFMSGLNDLLDGLMLNRTPHVLLYNEIKPALRQPVQRSLKYQNSYHFISSIRPSKSLPQIHNSIAIIEALHHDKRVHGVAPKVFVQVFYNVGTVHLTGEINGISPADENKLFSFADYVTEGNYMDLNIIPNSIILGKGAAETMLIARGDAVEVTTVRGDRLRLKVVGFFQSGISQIDKLQSYVSVATAQKLLGEPSNYITDIQLKLHDMKQAPFLAKEFENRYDLDALDIQTANSQFETGSFVRTIISYAVGITLLVVAGFGIYNILNMMIYEKMDSIAILKATGFSGKDVKLIFLAISLSIGVFGGITGLIFGFGLSELIDQMPFETASLPTVKTYPIHYDPFFYLIGGVFSVVTTYLAGSFPARKASKVDPVEIIRGK